MFYRDKTRPDGMRLFIIGKPLPNEISRSAMEDVAGCLMEGELDGDGFHAFDMLAFENRDVRGDPQETLIVRLDHLDRVIPAILRHSNVEGLCVKEMRVFGEGDGAGLAREAQEILRQHPSAEGLIFTPCNIPYPRSLDDNGHLIRMWPELLKFKPDPESVTVDLRYFNGRGRIRPGLYALLSGREVPFRPRMYPAAGDLGALETNPDVALSDGDIVECSFRVKHCPDGIDRLSLKPIRVRNDKSTPNNMSVSDGVHSFGARSNAPVQVCLDNLHCSIVAPCTMEDFDTVQFAPDESSRRVDEFWLAAPDLEAYEQGQPVSGFANDIRVLRLPGTGVIGVLASLAPLPRPEKVLPPPPPLAPTLFLTGEKLETMKVVDLKVECRSRGLTVKGIREELIARLRPFVEQ